MKGIETGRGGKGNRVVVTDIYTHAHMHTHLTRETTWLGFPNTPPILTVPHLFRTMFMYLTSHIVTRVLAEALTRPSISPI